MVTIEQFLAAGRSGPVFQAGRNAGDTVTLTANTDSATAVPTGAQGALVWISASGALVQGRYVWRDSSTAITITATNMAYLPAQASSHIIPAGMTHLHLACDVAATAYISWLF